MKEFGHGKVKHSKLHVAFRIIMGGKSSNVISSICIPHSTRRIVSSFLRSSRSVPHAALYLQVWCHPNVVAVPHATLSLQVWYHPGVFPVSHAALLYDIIILCCIITYLTTALAPWNLGDQLRSWRLYCVPSPERKTNSIFVYPDNWVKTNSDVTNAYLSEITIYH